MAIVTFDNDPVAGMHGRLSGMPGYYVRKWKGLYIVQRCPNRSKHKKTKGEALNQRCFAARYAGTNKKR